MLGALPIPPWAAALRRRPLSRLFLSFCLAAAVATGCARAPEFDLAGARSAARRALDRLETRSPAEAKRIAGLVELAEKITTREREARFWERAPGTVEAAWGRRETLFPV